MTPSQNELQTAFEMFCNLGCHDIQHYDTQHNDIQYNNRLKITLSIMSVFYYTQCH